MKPQVVVVDDEPEIVQVVCDVLEDEGIQATSCPHGRQALTCIRRKQPRVLLLDIQMPDVDGITLFRELREDPATSTLPVIFVTANEHLLNTHLPDYCALGAEVLPKPFDLDVLVHVVGRVLAA
jgi:CheY-like chemotaxis protein